MNIGRTAAVAVAGGAGGGGIAAAGDTARLTDGDGQFAGLMQISKTLSQPGLLRAINGSLQVAVLSTLLVVPLAYGYAALCRVQLPMRGCSACWPCCLCWHRPCCPAFHWFTCSAIRAC
jgi:ABC-type Fe3+ transport system permease subunit